MELKDTARKLQPTLMFSSSSYITVAAQEEFLVTRLVLYLDYFFPPSFPPSFPHLSYVTLLRLTRARTCTCMK